MNKPVIDFYFDFISPYSYLALIRLQQIGQQHDGGVNGADVNCSDVIHFEVNYLPVNLPKLIAWSGNTPPTSIKNKARYSLRDLKRWAAYMDVPFKMILPGSFDSRPAMRVALALQGDDRMRYVQAVFESIWSAAVDPRGAEWLEQVFLLHQLPPVWLTQSDDSLDALTQQALDAGAFGVPSFFLKQAKGRAQMFFGLDHMDFLERALTRA